MTGAWLVSTVILNLVALDGEEGTHTRARGRLNLDWRTLGTPEKNAKYVEISESNFKCPFCSIANDPLTLVEDINQRHLWLRQTSCLTAVICKTLMVIGLFAK